MRHRYKGHHANIWRRPGAKHCSSLCSQSEGGEYCGGQARAENPTKSYPRALVMFATCSWPSLCEQSELQCWRRNRRLCGSAQISATRVLPLTFDISILNALPFRGAVASLPILIFLDFEHPTCPPENASRKSCIPTCRRTPSQTHPFHIPDAVVSRPRRGRVWDHVRQEA